MANTNTAVPIGIHPDDGQKAVLRNMWQLHEKQLTGIVLNARERDYWNAYLGFIRCYYEINAKMWAALPILNPVP